MSRLLLLILPLAYMAMLCAGGGVAAQGLAPPPEAGAPGELGPTGLTRIAPALPEEEQAESPPAIDLFAIPARPQSNPWDTPPPAGPHRREFRHNTYDDGRLRTQWVVLVGPDGTTVRHGGLVRYHPNGRIALRAQYRNGRPVGLWRWFDEHGNLLRSEVPQGDYAQIVSGHNLANPNTIYRDPEGRPVAEGLRKLGEAHGAWTYYHTGGTVSAQGNYLNGLPDGRWTFYYRTGQVERQEHYKLGVPHGELRFGHPNGQERLHGHMEQGLRVGSWRTWYDNGQIESEGVYREDRREGVWRFWSRDGSLSRHVRYASGQVAEELPLPAPRRIRAGIVPDPQLRSFRPRLYDETGEEIKYAGP